MFVSSAVYATAAQVARQLNTPDTMHTSAAISAGDTQITLSIVQQGVTVGSQLCVDFNGTNAETVAVSDIEGTTVTVSAFQFPHLLNVPVADVTTISDYLAPASRYFDSVMWRPQGFAQESVTETLDGFIRRGELVAYLGKPEVSTVASAQIMAPYALAQPIDLEESYILGGDAFHAPMPMYSNGPVSVELSYTGGYSPLPADIAHATSVIAARMYKQRDSGFSDAIASDATGTYVYNKELPNEVKQLIPRYRRRVL